MSFIALPAYAESTLSDRPEPPPPQPDVHGFLELAVKNAYITPRGLVVHTKGAAIQPLAGFAFDLHSSTVGTLNSLSLSTGGWADLQTTQNSDYVGIWNEFDYFAGISAKLFNRLDLAATYYLFVSPPHEFKFEHNIEFKFGLDDHGYIKNFGFRPYTKLFWTVDAGASTVVYGRKGMALDVEVGLSPIYNITAIQRYPISVMLPAFLTFGGPGFFGHTGLLEVFAVGPIGSVLLDFVPRRFGTWYFEGGVTYFHLLDGNLVRASRLLGNSGSRDEWVGVSRMRLSF